MLERIRNWYWDLKEWWFFRQGMRQAPSAPHPEPPVEFYEIEGIRLVGVHKEAACAGRTCIIHSPTDHHMRLFPLHWRSDRGIFERICEHGVGHYDPDQMTYWKEQGWEGMDVHGCCGYGCCVPPDHDEEKQ